MQTERFDLTIRVDAAIDAALGSRIVGCVVLVSRRGERLYSRAAGFSDRESQRPMTEDAIFRLASVTKPIVATAALRMVEDGLLSLNDAVDDYLPWFTPEAPGGGRPLIRLRHLLTHTSGLTYDVPDDVSTGSDPGPVIPLEENLQRLSRQPLFFRPGERWEYGVNIDVLGGVLAAVNGTPSDLEAVVSRYVTEPLGMTDTHFFVTDPARLTTPYFDGESEPVRMTEPFPRDARPAHAFSPARIFERNAPQCGGSGMAGTAGDVLKLMDALQTGRILHEDTRRQAFANQIADLRLPEQDGPGRAFSFLGAVLTEPDLANSPCPAGTLDWGGVWGHNWIVDPVTGTTVVTCTNTTYEGCNGPFREEIRNAVYG